MKPEAEVCDYRSTVQLSYITGIQSGDTMKHIVFTFSTSKLIQTQICNTARNNEGSPSLNNNSKYYMFKKYFPHLKFTCKKIHIYKLYSFLTPMKLKTYIFTIPKAQGKNTVFCIQHISNFYGKCSQKSKDSYPSAILK